MERRHLIPRNRQLENLLDELKLAGTCREDDTSMALLCDGGIDVGCNVCCRCRAELILVRKHAHGKALLAELFVQIISRRSRRSRRDD